MAINLLEKIPSSETETDCNAHPIHEMAERTAIFTDGIFLYKNQCRIWLSSSSIIQIESGMILICGARVVIDAPESISVILHPSEPIPMQVIMRLTVHENEVDNAVQINMRPIQHIQQDAIFIKGSGIYEVELAQFTAIESGIKDLQTTIGKARLKISKEEDKKYGCT